MCVCAIMVRWSMIIITLKRNGKCTEYGVLVHITCQFLVQLRVTIRNNETSSEFAKIFFVPKLFIAQKNVRKPKSIFEVRKEDRHEWKKILNTVLCLINSSEKRDFKPNYFESKIKAHTKSFRWTKQQNGKYSIHVPCQSHNPFIYSKNL